MVVKSLFVQSPFQYKLKEVELPKLADDEALIEVIACGICGFDLEISGFLSPDGYTALGHEYVGIVKEVGKAVTNVKVGDQVTAESSYFCGYCDNCRNGRVDLCQSAPKTINNGYAQGFAEMTIAPAKALVVCNDVDPLTVVLSEPAGVSLDLTKVAEIQITDDVMIVGMGPIGFMAFLIARKATCGKIVCVDNLKNRLEKATSYGADEVYESMESVPDDMRFNKILLTAVPQLLPMCIAHSKYGAYIAFLGSNFKDGGNVSIDTHAVHFGKIQIRSSFASPATYFPEVHKIMKGGILNGKDIITHVFKLSEYETAFNTLIKDKNSAMKIIITNDNYNI